MFFPTKLTSSASGAVVFVLGSSHRLRFEPRDHVSFPPVSALANVDADRKATHLAPAPERHVADTSAKVAHIMRSDASF